MGFYEDEYGEIEKLTIDGDIIYIGKFNDHRFWPMIEKFGYPPLNKHDVRIILESMIQSFNSLTDEDIESRYKEIDDEFNLMRGDVGIRRIPEEKFPKRGTKQGWVYVLHFNDNKTKIGLSKDPISRRKGIISNTTYSDTDVNCFITYKTEDINSLESLIHNNFRNELIRREWFNLNSEQITKCKECKFNQNILDLIMEVKIH